MMDYMSGMKMFDPGLFAIAIATLVGQTWAIVHVLDADRPTKEKFLWVLLVLLTGLIGAGVYYLSEVR
jgi:hypothetical protein